MAHDLIGLGHRARSGKDTAAAALVDHLGYRRVAFADKLKELALRTDPVIMGEARLSLIVDEVGWERAKDWFPEVRPFLQRLGVAARDTFGDTFWIDQALAGIRPGERVVITDARFANEAAAIHAAGGRMVKIDRPGLPEPSHVSELELLDYVGWDAVITNDGTIEEFEQRVVELATSWLESEEVATCA